MTTTDHGRTYSTFEIDQCIAQARKWASTGDNGWTPNREQVTALADEVERLRAAVEDAYSDGYSEGHSDGHTSASEGTT